jgi:tetratricopeptide (TPR) repeat protein
MTQFVTGFQVLGKPFIAAYQQQTDFSKPTAVATPTGETLPLKGLGRALAVGCFLHDADSLGGGGANMGYVVKTDSQGQRYAQLIKIDAGAAFAFLESDSDIYAHDPRKRNMFFGLQKEFILRYDQLNLADQAEFAQAAKYILQVPKSVFKTVIDQGITADGFTQLQADRILHELLARKSTFLNGFAPEVSAQLKVEVRDAREALLGGLLRKPEALSVLSFQKESKLIATSPSTSITSPSTITSPSSSGIGFNDGNEDDRIETKGDAKRSHDSSNPEIFSGSAANLDRSHTGLVEPEQDIPSSKVNMWVSARSSDGSAVSPTGVLRASSSNSLWASSTIQAFVDLQESASTATSSTAGTEEELLAKEAAAEREAVYLAAQLEKERLRGEKKEEKGSCQVFQKPMVNKHFTGRETALAEVTKQLHRGNSSVVAQGISGLGGIGKTQIAARYAQLASEGAICGGHKLHYQAVVWLNAEHNLDVQFLTLAELWCNKTKLTPEQAVAIVYRYLQGKRTLVVFDNAVDKESIALFLPPSKLSAADRFKTAFSSRDLHILITTRNLQWQDMPMLTVTGFSTAEAVDFVCKHFETASQEDIVTLVETVSTLPLALSHAVAYIAEGHSTLQDYPRQFALHQLSLGGIKTQTDASHTILTTFLLTLFRLKQQHPAVIPILYACAYLAPDDIPVVWLETGLAGPETTKGAYMLGKFTLQEVQTAILALQRHALLQRGTSEMLSIHRLVQQVIRHQSTATEQYSQFQRVLQWLNTANPDQNNSLETERAWQAFLPHLEALLECHRQSKYTEDVEWATLLHKIGRIELYLLVQYKKSFEAFKRAFAVLQARSAEDPYQTTEIMKDLGVVYTEQGKYSEGQKLLENALQLAGITGSQRLIGGVLRSLGDLSTKVGKYEHAQGLYFRALKVQEAEAAQGRDYHQLAATLMNLSILYDEMYNFEAQRNILEYALQIDEMLYGKDHIVVAQILMHLGDAYGNLKNIVRKRDLLQRALKITEAHQGKASVFLSFVLTSLGAAYGNLDDLDKAQETLERALAIKEQEYGLMHPALLVILQYLTVHYYRVERYSLAFKTAQRLCQIATSHSDYGFAHPLVKRCLEHLEATCGFTVERLLSDECVPEEKQIVKPPLLDSGFSGDKPSMAQAAVSQGVMSEGNRQAHRRLGAAVVDLVMPINSQRQADWYHEGHLNIASTLVHALAKGRDAFLRMCTKPELNSIPPGVKKFILKYVEQHPELHGLSNYPDFARSLVNDLAYYRWTELQARFGIKTEQKGRTVGAKKPTSCLLM